MFDAALIEKCSDPSLQEEVVGKHASTDRAMKRRQPLTLPNRSRCDSVASPVVVDSLFDAVAMKAGRTDVFVRCKTNRPHGRICQPFRE
jgi:hypothetical protein